MLPRNSNATNPNVEQTDTQVPQEYQAITSSLNKIFEENTTLKKELIATKEQLQAEQLSKQTTAIALQQAKQQCIQIEEEKNKQLAVAETINHNSINTINHYLQQSQEKKQAIADLKKHLHNKVLEKQEVINNLEYLNQVLQQKLTEANNQTQFLHGIISRSSSEISQLKQVLAIGVSRIETELCKINHPQQNLQTESTRLATATTRLENTLAENFNNHSNKRPFMFIDESSLVTNKKIKTENNEEEPNNQQNISANNK